MQKLLSKSQINFEETVRQNVVTIEIPNSLDNGMSYQIATRQSQGEAIHFSGSCLQIENGINF